MKIALFLFPAIVAIGLLSGCQTNPSAKSEAGAYNYTPGFIWGETTAIPVFISGTTDRSGDVIPLLVAA